MAGTAEQGPKYAPVIRTHAEDRIASDDVAAIARLRISKHIKIDSKTGCWLWSGSRQRSGHGRMTFLKRPVEAHRLSFMAHRGSIPARHDLDHLCRTPHCVNPNHLEPVTRRENLLRGATIPASLATRNACNYGHPFTASNTGISEDGYRFCKECKRAQARERYHRRKSVNGEI